MSKPADIPVTTIGSGVPGLDEILGGGFTTSRLYLVEGIPGAGKTTLALQFLMEGARLNEPVLYMALSENEEEIRAVAASHGWALGGITIREIVPEQSLDPDEQNTMFHPSEVELCETSRKILEDVERIKPRRVVLDSLSELRLLAGSALRFRRQILALKHFFTGRACTVLLLDELTGVERDMQVLSISHGVILLEQMNPDYGTDRHRLRVVKYRGRSFRGGYHDYLIRRGGIRAYPRLTAAGYRRPSTREKIASGIPALDSLLGGGMELGTSTLIIGAAGTGKSTLAAEFATAAAACGRHASLFIFDETMDTMLTRMEGLGVDLRKQVNDGRITVQPVDPAELSPGEFTQRIRDAVEKHGASMIVIDSLSGYLNAMPEERFLTIQLHELLMYLAHQGVATFLVGAQHGLIGSRMQTPVDASYLADTVILLRYFEASGEVRRAISVVKKRGGEHERTIREFFMNDGRLEIGETLSGFRGILAGTTAFQSLPAGPDRSGLHLQ